MNKTIVVTENLDEVDERRLERAGYKPVVMWERHVEGTAALTVVLRSVDALADVSIMERREVRRRLRAAS